MAAIKFGDYERKTVIERIEIQKSIKLRQVGTKKILLKGSDGLYYCIVGGTGDWHGIPQEVMDQEKKDGGSVHLVIARWLKTRIEVYEGLLKPLFDSKGSLSRTMKGVHQFNLKTPTNGILSIKEVPGAKFPKIDEFIAPFVSQFKTLPVEVQRNLLEKWV